MGQFTADIKYIASIYSTRLEPITLAHGDSPDPRSGRGKRYWVPPIPRFGKPDIDELPDPKDPNCAKVRIVKIPPHADVYCAVMEVYDSQENVPDIGQIGARGMGQGVQNNMPRVSKLVPVEIICDQILRYWRDSIVGLPVGAAPGIMIINNSAPTQEEYQKMLMMQTMYYEYYFMQGEAEFQNLNLGAKNRELIRPVMRDAATWLAQPRNWSTAQLSADKVPCPLCGVLKPNNTPICHACGKQVMAMPADLAAMNGIAVVPELVGAGASKPGKPAEGAA